MADGSFDSGTLTDVIDNVDSIDTGSSTSADVVTFDQSNVPSVINNSGSSDNVNVSAPDFTTMGVSTQQNQNVLNDLVSSEVTSANADYNPFDLGQLFDQLAGIDGPTQVKNAGSANSKTATGSGGTIPLGNLFKNLFGGGSAATASTGAVNKPIVVPKQTPSTDPLSKFLLGNASNTTTSIGGVNLNNLAILLTIITSIIIIFIFMKKGHT